MAVSPMVVHPTDPRPSTSSRAVSSPLKAASAVAGSNQPSSTGTPQPPVAPNVTAAAIQSASMDLAEQLNDEEKRKYVKGTSVLAPSP